MNLDALRTLLKYSRLSVIDDGNNSVNPYFGKDIDADTLEAVAQLIEVGSRLGVRAKDAQRAVDYISDALNGVEYSPMVENPQYAPVRYAIGDDGEIVTL